MQAFVKLGKNPRPAAAPPPAPAAPPAAPRRALSPKAQRLAEVLLARAHQGQCVISQAELCRLTGWDRTTVWRYLNELRKQGIIDWERQKRAPNRYRFLDVNCLQQADPALHPELAGLVARGHNVLILGPEGSGKSFQLALLAKDKLTERTVLRLPSGTLRDVLLYLQDELAEREGLEPQEDRKKTVRELSAQLLSTLAASHHSFLVLVDDVDRAPPGLRRLVLSLLSLYNVQVVATATAEAKLADLVDHFTVFTLPPLSEEQTAQWVHAFLSARHIPVLGGEHGIRRLARLIYLRTGGNPRKIQAFLRKIESRGYVDRQLLREELHVGGRFQFVDMTWLLVLTAAVAMAARYLSLGFHDRTLYVLAGLTYAAGILLRWFSYRWRRKEKP